MPRQAFPLTSRKTRIVMLASAVLIGAVLLAFAIAMLNARADRREAADERFQSEAQISAAVIESLFSSSAAQAAQEYGEKLGTPEVDPKALEAIKRRGRLAYALVLDERGRVLAETSGADDSVRGSIAENPSHVAGVLDGEPWRLSGIVRGNTSEYAAAFDSPYGRRVIVQGFPVQLIAGFLSGTLAKLPNADKENAFIIDGNGLVVGSADPGAAAPATKAPEPSGDSVQTAAGVGGSDWRVVLSADEANLYEGVNSLVQWLVLIALAVAGAVALYLLMRAMRQAEQLEDAYASLEETNAHLERTNIELARSNGELEQFASVASHDLQEPLRKVQTFGDQLERRHSDALDDEAKDYLRRMRNASARMSVLIDDLLRFSRVTTHAKPHVPVDLDRVAADVVQDLEARVTESGGHVDLGALPRVQADPTQMRQLLQNLIGNALKFHRPGVPPEVRVHAVDAPSDGMVAFAVSDNGIGFESDYEERIFRVFERLHPRDVYAGTGIGLALCRKIAERHGGAITGVGRPGEGSTFTVVLPAAQAPAPTAGAPPASEPVHA